MVFLACDFVHGPNEWFNKELEYKKSFQQFWSLYKDTKMNKFYLSCEITYQVLFMKHNTTTLVIISDYFNTKKLVIKYVIGTTSMIFDHWLAWTETYTSKIISFYVTLWLLLFWLIVILFEVSHSLWHHIRFSIIFS